MSLPTQYLTSVKNLEGILNAIKGAQAPERFTNGFLQSLEYNSSSDRLIVGVLKALGFLDDSGRPKQRYFEFLDQTQSERVLAEGVREAYADLFRVNIKANDLSKTEVVNKLKTLSQGQLSESVLDKMAMTFTALVKLADFSQTPKTDADALDDSVQKSAIGKSAPILPPPPDSSQSTDGHESHPDLRRKHAQLGGLVYAIEIHLPESRDPAVYDALFRSLKEHLLWQ
jgi:hypothetical protein